MLTWIFLTIFIVLFYWWLISIRNFWRIKNVPQTDPPSLLFGDFFDVIKMKRAFGDISNEIYKKFEGYSYVGIYKIRTPTIFIRDPKLLEKVLVTNFHNFHDNEIIVNEENNELLSKSAFFATGSNWKVVRNQALTCLTSGKMKSIFHIMQYVSEKLVDYIQEQCKISGKNGIDTKELSSRFTTENIVNCLYGLEANCFKEVDPPFLKMGNLLFSPGIIQGLLQCFFFVSPKLSNKLKIKFLPKYITDFFNKMTKDIISYRKNNNIKRNDCVETLQECKNCSQNFNDVDIAAHLLGFFQAGTETVSVALSFILYELATNSEAQGKLYQEIKELVTTKEPTYQSITALTYLEGVMKESLRLHPPFMLNTKITTKEFTFPPAKEGCDSLTVKPGTAIAIPYSGIHMDEKYFPNPTKFDPERFIGHRKNEIQNCTFLTFGEGPRTCLGRRFAQVQLKVAVFYIILNYELEVSNKMLLPIKLDPTSILSAPKGGIWIKYHKRN